ncbi:MAG: prolyl oligopeptidase family serine peptidase [Planctomycetaceae bacterium]
MRRGALLLLLAAIGHAGDATETLHGFEISDPFRSFETEAGASAWMQAQNAATEKHFAGKEGAAIRKRLDALSRLGGIGRARTVKDLLYFVRRTGDEEQGTLYVQVGGGEERKLLDVSALDPSGKTALDWYYPSPTGRFLAYGLSKDGSEDSVLHILDVRDGRAVDAPIPDARHASVAWLLDETGLYYTRFVQGDRYARRVRFHKLGTSGADDPIVFGEGLDKTAWPAVALSDDGATLLLPVYYGWDRSEVFLMDRAKGEAVCILSRALEAQFLDPSLLQGRLIVRTDHAAPRGKVVSIDPNDSDPSAWKTLVPEADWPIETIAISESRIAVQRLVKATARLELYALDGTPAGEVLLPGLGSLDGLDAEPTGHRFLFLFTSFLAPGGLYALTDGEGDAPKLLFSPPAPDTSHLQAEQVDYPSYDGTNVPLFILSRKGTVRDGSNPVLLTGYGGFSVPMTPFFSSAAITWLEHGGVWAMPNLRGGSEFGEEWHKAGSLANKHQVFRDFEYAMRHLIRTGWTRPQRLAIQGGSNGGLLMGAMMTQAPELFRACVGQVGLYDMIRYHRWPVGEFWVEEYGSGDNPAQTGYLLGYSPYHQVMDGVAYPAFFGTTAASDTRVTWIHTAKFVARLQQATAGSAPILFQREEKAGHGQGKSRSDRLAEQVRIFLFLFEQLGMEHAR